MEIDLRHSISSLVGKTPWGVRLGVGSMLTVEFGLEDPRQSTVTAHGEWHLWLYVCSWRIESVDEIIVACEDEPDKIKKKLQEIIWTEVSTASVMQPSMDLEIGFQNKHKLRTFSVNGSGEQEIEQWILFTPALRSISARGNMLASRPSTAYLDR